MPQRRTVWSFLHNDIKRYAELWEAMITMKPEPSSEHSGPLLVNTSKIIPCRKEKLLNSVSWKCIRGTI